jgi:hypothetical protein
MYSGGRSDKTRGIWRVRIQGTSFRGLSAHSRKASAYIYTAIIQTYIDTTVMTLHCPRITCHAPDGHKNELLQTFVSQADTQTHTHTSSLSISLSLSLSLSHTHTHTHSLTPVVQFEVMFLCTRCDVFAIVILNPT